MSEKVLAWHFTDGMKLRDGRKLVVGRTYRLPKGEEVSMCNRGYHGSERILDALKYAPGLMLSRTEHGGEIVKEYDKLCSSERTVLWCVDADKIVRRAAIVFARRVLAARKKASKFTDPRSWEALRVAELYLDGKATPDEMKAASAADAAYAADVRQKEREWQERYLVRLVNKARKEARRDD